MTDLVLEKLKSLKDNGKSSGVPLYERIRKNLEKMILNGDIPDNYRLPAEKEFASLIGVNHITLVKSLNQLRNQGLLVRSRARGTFVNAPKGENVSAPGEKNKLVAVIFDDVNPKTFQSELFISLHDNLLKNGLEMLFLSSSNQENIQYEQVKRILQQPNCCACLVWSIMETSQVRKLMKIKPFDFPLVFMDKFYKGVGHDCSIYDNVNAGKKLGRHILNQNYKKVVFLVRKTKFKYDSLSSRYYGLRKAFAEKNFDPDDVILYKFDEDKPFNFNEIISLSENGIVVSAVAKSAIELQSLLREKGHQSPNNFFPLISFGPSSGATSLADENISEIHFSPAELGENTVNILQERLNGSSAAWKCARSKDVFIERASSRKVRKRESALI